MKSKKKYTNTTFTKRVDHEAGRHRAPRGRSEPAICASCGAFYANRRWTIGSESSDNEKPKHWQPAEMTTCPACLQKSSGEPRGFVFLNGEYFVAHEDEIRRLLVNEAARAAEDNPLARILQWKLGDGHKLTVSTTTEHLAQRLGRALKKACGGTVRYDFSHENKLARVTWERE